MAFNTTFKNISVLSNWAALLGGGNRSTRKKTTDLSQVTDKLYPIMLWYTSPWLGFELTTLVVIGTDCIGKSNYHTITTTLG